MVLHPPLSPNGELWGRGVAFHPGWLCPRKQIHVVAAGWDDIGTRIFPLNQGGLVAWSSRQQSG